jgi:hypothetical protein
VFACRDEKWMKIKREKKNGRKSERKGKREGREKDLFLNLLSIYKIHFNKNIMQYNFIFHNKYRVKNFLEVVQTGSGVHPTS